MLAVSFLGFVRQFTILPVVKKNNTMNFLFDLNKLSKY